MRVFCPSCQEPVTISDDLAGKATFCPLCKAAFTAPTLFTSQAPAPPSAAPGGYSVLPPPEIPANKGAAESPPRDSAPRTPDATPAPAQPPGLGGGYTRSLGFSVTAEAVQWVAPAGLVLSVLLTFFSWNGAFPGGYGVYTQGPWRALFGSFSGDTAGEKVLNLDPDKAPDGQTRLRDEVHGNYLFLLYLPLLLLAAALAVFFTIQPILKLQIPPSLEPHLQWRMALVAGLSLLLLLMLTYQCLRGFGLENALEERAHASLKDKPPERPTDEERKRREIEEGMAEARLAIRHTTAFKLTYLLHILAAAGAGGMFALERYRVNKPWPRVEVLW